MIAIDELRRLRDLPMVHRTREAIDARIAELETQVNTKLFDRLSKISLDPNIRRCLSCGCKTVSENRLGRMLCCSNPVSDVEVLDELMRSQTK